MTASAIAVKVEEVGKKIGSIETSLASSVEKLKTSLCQALEVARAKEFQKFVSDFYLFHAKYSSNHTFVSSE